MISLEELKILPESHSPYLIGESRLRCNNFYRLLGNMNPLHRMSFKQAELEAKKIASDFLANSDSKGFEGELGGTAPDPMKTEKLGKLPRHWISSVSWTKDGSELDGPSIVRIDLVKLDCEAGL